MSLVTRYCQNTSSAREIGVIVRRASLGVIGGLTAVIILSGCTAKNTTRANTTRATQSVEATSSGGPESTAAASEPTSGTVTDVADRVSVTLPPGYTRLDPAQVEGIFGSQLATFKDAKIIAVKMPLTRPVAGAVAVDVAPATGFLPSQVDQVFQQASDALTGGGATIKSHSSAPVAGYPVLRIDYTLPVNARTLEGTEVFMIYKEKLYFTTVLQDEASYSATEVNDVINSITFA